MTSWRFVKILLTGSLAFASSAQAFSLFPAGSSSKANGMESALVKDGAGAVFYNPSALSLTSAQGSTAEIGFVAVSYAYEHPDFDPVILKVNSPTVSVAYATKVGRGWSTGFGLFPTKNGETHIPGVPRRIGDTMYSVDVTQKETVIQGGLGGAYQLNAKWSVGLGTVIFFENIKTEAHLVQTSASLITSEQKGLFVLPKVGVTGQVTKLRVAASGNPALVKHYQGDVVASAQASDAKTVGYEPAAFDLGLEWAEADWSVGTHHNAKLRRGGRAIVRAGTGSDGVRADLKNTWERAVTVATKFTANWRGSMGYAFVESPWGDGTTSAQNDQKVDGVDFGQLDGIDRHVISVASQWTPVRRWRYEATLSRAFGSRTVGGGAENAGRFQLDYTLLNLGVTAQL